MNAIQNMKSWIGALTDLGLTLLALGIVAALLVGGANIPFFGNVAGNITNFVKDLGSQSPEAFEAAHQHHETPSASRAFNHSEVCA